MSDVKQSVEQSPGQMRLVMSQVKRFLEITGIYIFFVSSVLFTQLRWVKKYNKISQLEVRLMLGFLAGLLLSYIIVKLIRKIMSRYSKEDESLIRDLSFALSPGILFIFGTVTKKFLLLGLVLCALAILYVRVKSFRDFIDSIIFIDKFKAALIIKDGRAEIDMQGTYERANPKAMQSFLSDLSISFYECSEMKIEEVKVDFSNLKEKNENELRPIIESVAGYFDLKVSY